jgi:hypothetical protein
MGPLNFESALDWIEAHQTTVDLLKWVMLLVLGWMLGLFRAIRDWTRRPAVEIDSRYSSCYVEQHDRFGDYADVILIAALVDVGITNPTKDKVGVKRLGLSVRRNGLWPCWSKEVSAVGLPSPPTFPLGEHVKLIPVWFTAFSDDYLDLRRTSADPQDSVAALALFVVLVDRKNLPELGDSLLIKVNAYLATGQVCRQVGKIKVYRDFTRLGCIVAGSEAYVRAPAVWEKID